MTYSNADRDRLTDVQADVTQRRHCSYCFSWRPLDGGRKLLRRNGTRMQNVWMCGACLAKRTR